MTAKAAKWLACASLLAALSCTQTVAGPGGSSVDQGTGPPDVSVPDQTPPNQTAFIVAVGDIATCGVDGAAQTAALLDTTPGTILGLGDLAYPNGTADDFRKCFEPSWGRHKGRIRPAPGNHEYADNKRTNADDYFSYFGLGAGPSPGAGFYAFDVGNWKMYSLNSNIDAEPGSAQYSWLQSELLKNPKCSLAYWHHPVVSSGQNGSSPKMQSIWRLLADNNVEVALTGHDHQYEVFDPQDGAMRSAPTNGMREFVVGTGGTAPLYNFFAIKPNSRTRISQVWGVLKMTLTSTGYTWDFVAVNNAVMNSGSDTCH